MSDGIIRALVAAVVMAAEWWLMQPYHDPLQARLWLALTAFWRRLAEAAGWLALDAEHNYYLTSGAAL